MNRSGQACAQLLAQFDVAIDRMLVIYDEMDLAVGRVQIKPKGGAGSHNGMVSIIASVASSDFPRVRIGIGSPAFAGADHVLSRFEVEEIELVRNAIAEAVRGCEIVVSEGIDIAMNRINLPEYRA
jgi:PTH1 family peptidyl-tRNA hydrolase